MDLKKILFIYKKFSQLMGISAIATLLYFLSTSGMRGCIIMFEPLWYVRIPEVIMGFLALPYLFYKILKD